MSERDNEDRKPQLSTKKIGMNRERLAKIIYKNNYIGCPAKELADAIIKHESSIIEVQE